jgi:hypothetical protein
MRATASILPFLFLAICGCSRKLPGPEACRAFALAELGVQPGTPATALPRVPGLSAQAEELTRQCLATPWDYPLLGCLQARGSEQLCLARFQQRRASGYAHIE